MTTDPFIDTANIYCKGESEKIVGKALKPIRNHVILLRNLRRWWWSECGRWAVTILSFCWRELKRLDTDWIDLYYMLCMTKGLLTMRQWRRCPLWGKRKSDTSVWAISCFADRWRVPVAHHHFWKPIVKQNVLTNWHADRKRNWSIYRKNKIDVLF
jgi:aryl-alcohol dehydrogenase-like predicted oxidoreductase